MPSSPVAVMKTRAGELCMFTNEAVSVCCERLFHTDGGAARLIAECVLHDGFTIEEWVQDAKPKSRIASQQCRENGILKSKLYRKHGSPRYGPPPSSAAPCTPPQVNFDQSVAGV